MNNIKKELHKIFVGNPDVVGVGYAKKITNGIVTDETCLSFGVKKKLPLSEVSDANLIPSEIEIDGVIYNTDVTELGNVKPLACSLPSTCYDCYDPNPYTANPCATNCTASRPIKGGTAFLMGGGSYGTLGFFAVHTPTQAIVAITNAHVASTEGAYYNAVTGGNANCGQYGLYKFTDRPFLGAPRIDGNINFYTNFGLPAHVDTNSPPPYVNRIDAAMVAVKQYDPNTGVPMITNAESWKQIGLSDVTDGVNTPPPFAATEELDALLDFTNLEVWSSGARTGIKKGECSLKIVSDDYLVSFYAGSPYTIFTYDNIIQISRSDISCVAIDGGDSGSAVMGKVPTYNPSDPNWKNGPRTWKILGLAFAGATSDTENYGLVCRIDHIAQKLQIEAWDGLPKAFLDVDNMDYQVLEGAVLDNPKTINGKEYWQIGAINNAKQSTILS